MLQKAQVLCCVFRRFSTDHHKLRNVPHLDDAFRENINV